jgi:hypothetical protein
MGLASAVALAKSCDRVGRSTVTPERLVRYSEDAEQEHPHTRGHQVRVRSWGRAEKR